MLKRVAWLSAAFSVAFTFSACDTQVSTDVAPAGSSAESVEQSPVEGVPIDELHLHVDKAEVERRLPELAALGVHLAFDEDKGVWSRQGASEATTPTQRGPFISVRINDPAQQTTTVVETTQPGSLSLPVDVDFISNGEGTNTSWNERISWARVSSCSRNAATSSWTDLHLRGFRYGDAPYGNSVQTSFRPGSYGLYAVEARGWVNLYGIFPFPVLLDSEREVGCYSVARPYVAPTPTITLTHYPLSPTVGSTVELAATVRNAPAPITQYEWGVNGQHTFTTSRTHYITYTGGSYVSVTAYFADGTGVTTSRFF